MSFVDWYNRERIERARRLLCQTDMRVNEIAAKRGHRQCQLFQHPVQEADGQDADAGSR